ncbi:MAG: hypothetical protein WCP06_14355 [Verrucomicrobiota bacterium]|jgi:ubiquinone biosynthesis protein Coq4
MILPEFSQTQARALAGSLEGVATASGHSASAAQNTVIDGLARLILGVADRGSIEPVDPASLSDALDSPEQREMAAELLVLIALVDIHPDPQCTAEANRYCRALGMRPENLDLLQEVAQRKIKHSRHRLFTRFIADSIRTGSLKSEFFRLEQMFRDAHDHPDIAAPYLALERLPEDTFGNYFFHFYRNRGFKFPGEKGGLPTAWGFEVHDASHILSGYNTDPCDEINVLAFEAGSTSRLPWLLIGVNLVTFNSGLAYGPTKLLHYRPHEGNLDPAEFVRALDRGVRVTRDLSANFDIHAAWEIPLADLRGSLGIEGDGDVREDPKYASRLQ